MGCEMALYRGGNHLTIQLFNNQLLVHSEKTRTFAVLNPKNPVEMAKKGNRVQVILECTEHKNSGQPGTSRYVTTKNRKNTPERIELKKFNPVLKKMTVHKEIK